MHVTPDTADPSCRIPAPLRASLERALNIDLGWVRLHFVDPDPASGWASGSDITLTTTPESLETIDGRWLLGHELAHVLQQRSYEGLQRFPAGATVVDEALEYEADRFADALVAGGNPVDDFAHLLNPNRPVRRGRIRQNYFGWREPGVQSIAQSFAAGYGERCGTQPFSYPVQFSDLPAAADPTLTLVGHGGQPVFASMDPPALARMIKVWKDHVQPSLTEVEMLACDVVHGQNSAYPSFVAALQQELDLLGGSVSGVELRTLPIGLEPSSISVLYTHTSSGTFLYVTAPDPTEFATFSRAFEAAKKALKTSSAPSPDLIVLGRHLANITRRSYTLHYGRASHIRSFLVDFDSLLVSPFTRQPTH